MIVIIIISFVQGLLDFDPFARIDEEGVGGLIRTALEKARARQPETKVLYKFVFHSRGTSTSKKFV